MADELDDLLDEFDEMLSDGNAPKAAAPKPTTPPSQPSPSPSPIPSSTTTAKDGGGAVDDDIDALLNDFDLDLGSPPPALQPAASTSTKVKSDSIHRLNSLLSPLTNWIMHYPSILAKQCHVAVLCGALLVRFWLFPSLFFPCFWFLFAGRKGLCHPCTQSKRKGRAEVLVLLPRRFFRLVLRAIRP